MAGVTRAMLEDTDTLQFILDTVQKIGGAPHNLEQLQEEAVDPTGISISTVISILNSKERDCISLEHKALPHHKVIEQHTTTHTVLSL